MNTIQKGIELVDSMTDEELSKHIDYIRATLTSRRRNKADKNRALLEVGDSVVIEGNTKPKYLQGMTGTIEAKRDTRVAVRLDAGPTGKFRSGVVLFNPAGLRKV
jgi:hypothetical protein